MPCHACDPATLPRPSHGVLQGRQCPGHCSSCGTAVRGSSVVWGLLTPLLCSEQPLHLQTLAGLSVPMCQGQQGQRRAAAWLSLRWCHHPLVWGTVQAANFPPSPASCSWDMARRGGPAQGPAWGTGGWAGGCTGGAQGHAAMPQGQALATEVTPLVLGEEERRPWAQLLPSPGGS